MSIQSVKKLNEQLQQQVTKLQKQLKEKEKQNEDLLKKLEKYEKTNKNSSAKKKAQSSDSSDESGDDNNLKILNRMNKNSLLSAATRMSLKELEQRRSIREETNKKEELITNIQKECLRKCNQYLSIILSDFQAKWNRFEEIDILKKNDTTIILNKLQEKIDSSTTQYLTLCELNVWENEQKYKTGKDLMECYQSTIEEILVLKNIK